MLFETGSLKDQTTYDALHTCRELPGIKLTLFLQSVERGHRSEK